MKSKHSYSQAEKDAVYRTIAERRDMRHFVDGQLEEGLLARLLTVANQAPSVGLMQPWRFIRITQPQLKQSIKSLVESERNKTAELLDERKKEFLKLKVEGISECAELIVVALPEGREKHIFGRRTMPDMDLASVSCAIQNMWLAARAEGIGLGWVSLFDPLALADLLNMPSDSRPIAILCIGHVEKFYEKPMLVEQQWATPETVETFLYENSWPQSK
ncbi:5,6-dimethylbenzimidazole synthase [Vibrio sp. UCD-FRSSP16_10]|uniref:5,6-dimethylbenzimidazole synthase n=1 Tax=unclassified Vibrio TaxID=2614977 RepID=UPI0007FC89BC|nr:MULTISPECIES: 5,6-dimethylbenzimidazole synthase [unclassified Vibrio]OBT13012.1 5,6-dimethylbenzimidazole synthase [Vibrio sp. UCD-FRSSP16_30]OBT19255.1 5,6-dimethylbenzimidazole synthase [Vibrio sp. UCD-FRSSP16_10]